MIINNYLPIRLRVLLIASLALFTTIVLAQSAPVSLHNERIGGSKEAALKNGFKLETFEGATYLLKNVPNGTRFDTTIILTPALHQGQEKIFSISVSRLFESTEEGKKHCIDAAQKSEYEVYESLKRRVTYKEPIIIGKNLPHHLSVEYAINLTNKDGNTGLMSSCVGEIIAGTKVYTMKAQLSDSDLIPLSR
jgi:hypothetical protein